MISKYKTPIIVTSIILFLVYMVAPGEFGDKMPLSETTQNIVKNNQSFGYQSDTRQKLVSNSQAVTHQTKRQQKQIKPKTPTKLSKTNKRPTTKTQRILVAENSYVAYMSGRLSGIIGLYDGNKNDNPVDNTFTVNIESELYSTDRVWLNYKLKGVSHHNGIACSINDRLSFGGYLVKTDTATQKQRVRIHPSWLNKGENNIRFGLAETARYGYKISDLSIEVERTNEVPQILIVDAAKTLYDGKSYIHGFINGIGDYSLEIDGQEIALRDGEFETLMSPLADSVCIIAKNKAKSYKKVLHFSKNESANYAFQLETDILQKEQLFAKNMSESMKTALTLLKAPEKTMIKTQRLSATDLRPIDLPSLDLGMTNVTVETRGVRFLPHGEHFSGEGATIALKYDRTKIPDGYTEDDINTYYFDQRTNHWVALDRDSVDKSLCMVVSKTTHFTDMINGVIQAPESPETQGFAPTMMNDIKAADPGSKIGLIAPPSANNQGSATLSYPLELPPAFKGMSPQLAIQYNSDGGSGWLGEGWDLNVPSITVDTRWGVPRYDPLYETETYIMNGTMLATIVNDVDNTTDTICGVSLSHRGIQYERLTNGQQFHPRVESEFSKIIRKGETPGTYTWEMYDKNGTKYTYGGNNGILKGKITDINGNEKEVIAEWKLSSIEHINTLDKVSYYYNTDNTKEEISNGVFAKTVYLSNIKVSGNFGPYESIEFKSDSVKSKKTNNARYGFLTSNNRLLNKVVINYAQPSTSNTSQISELRSYSFSYKDAAFSTTILDSVSYLDNNGAKISSHTFDYYDNFSANDNQLYHSNLSDRWDLKQSLNSMTKEIPAIGGSRTNSKGSSFYAGVGVDDLNWVSESNTVGYSTSISQSTSEKISTLIDINGDGLLDKVYKLNGALYFRPNVGSKIFGDQIQLLNAPTSFSNTTSKTSSDGWKGKVKVPGIPLEGSMGMDWNFSRTKTKVYFSDVNNDGLIDIVDNGKVWFNKCNSIENGIAVPSFTLNSSETPNPIMNIKTPTSSSELIISENPLTREESAITLELKRLLEASPMQDMVRVWEAPFDGFVELDGQISYASPTEEFDTVRYANNADGLYITQLSQVV